MLVAMLLITLSILVLLPSSDAALFGDLKCYCLFLLRDCGQLVFSNHEFSRKICCVPTSFRSLMFVFKWREFL